MKIPTLTLLLLTLIVGCAKKEDKRIDLVTFPLRGEVVEVDTVKNRVMVAHEEIPNYMAAMTMPFKVKDHTLLSELSVGDTIQATLAVSRTESWLETITVVGKGVAPDPKWVEGQILAKVLKEGDQLPDDTYLNQDEKKIRFSNYRGKAVGITFIYSRCPLPDYCILMSNNFSKVQKLLQQETGIQGKWHLVTVSFDPKFDTPRVMKQYGASYKADFSTWDFITDPDTNGTTVMRLADGLGLTYENDEGGLIAHNLRTVVLDTAGRIVKNYIGNEWTPQEIVAEIRKAAR